MSNNKESIDMALSAISDITFVPEKGQVHEGTVDAVMPYGVFVKFKNKSGLLHISEISHSRIDKVEDVFSEGDPVKVKILDIDNRSGKMKLSRKVLLPKPSEIARDND